MKAWQSGKALRLGAWKSLPDLSGDRYPGSTFIDHLLRYQADPECKILLLLGENGGIEEYRVIEAVKNGTLTKPVVAWAIGTCATMFKTEVQFGRSRLIMKLYL